MNNMTKGEYGLRKDRFSLFFYRIITSPNLIFTKLTYYILLYLLIQSAKTLNLKLNFRPAKLNIDSQFCSTDTCIIYICSKIPGFCIRIVRQIYIIMIGLKKSLDTFETVKS